MVRAFRNAVPKLQAGLVPQSLLYLEVCMTASSIDSPSPPSHSSQEQSMPRIWIFNPSNYPRDGYVSLPWQDIHNATGYEPEELVLYQDRDKPLFFQVDQIDPEDPSLDTLNFFLSRPLEPQPEKHLSPAGIVYITSQVKKRKSKKPESLPKQKKIVEMRNDKLTMHLNLTPDLESGTGFWYSGSATSVRFAKLKWVELLDYYKALTYLELGHDPEKRCAQLESIQLSHPFP